MKTIRYYTCDSRKIRWDADKCLHGSKCLKCVIMVADVPGILTIPVTSSQFNEILTLSTYCPAKALRLIED